MKYPDTHKFTIFDQNLAQVHIGVSIEDDETYILIENVHKCSEGGRGFVLTDRNNKIVSIPEATVRNFAISLERI